MPEVTVREPTIQGLAVFAARRFHAGECVRRVSVVREVTDDAPPRAEAVHCGAERCAATVLGEFFDLPIERRIEYLPLLAGWFVEMHRRRLTALAGKGPTTL